MHLHRNNNTAQRRRQHARARWTHPPRHRASQHAHCTQPLSREQPPSAHEQNQPHTTHHISSAHTPHAAPDTRQSRRPWWRRSRTRPATRAASATTPLRPPTATCTRTTYRCSRPRTWTTTRHGTGSAPERTTTQTSTTGSATARQHAAPRRPPHHHQRHRRTHHHHRCRDELVASEKVPEKSSEIPRKSYGASLRGGPSLPAPSQTRVCTGMTSMPRGRGGASLQASVATLRHYRPGLRPGTFKKKKYQHSDAHSIKTIHQHSSSFTHTSQRAWSPGAATSAGRGGAGFVNRTGHHTRVGAPSAGALSVGALSAGFVRLITV